MPLDPSSVGARRVVRGACPARLSGYVCAADDRKRRYHHRRARRPRSSADAGRAVHEGRALPRSHVLRPAPDASAEARRARRARAVSHASSWDEALSTIAERFGAHAQSVRWAPGRICRTATPARWAIFMARRWIVVFHRLGASLLDRSICASAGKAGWVATIGASVGMDMEQFEHSRLIIIWGSNPVTSNLHFWTRAQEAKRRGARLVAIDPVRSVTAEKCHEHSRSCRARTARSHWASCTCCSPRQLVDPRLYRPLHGRERRRTRCARGALDAATDRRRPAEYRPPNRSWRWRGLTARPEACSHPRQLRDAADRRTAATPCAPSLSSGTRSARGARPGRWRALVVVGHLSGRSTYRHWNVPTLFAARPRTIDMSTIGDALLDANDPPVRAIYVYNSNPVAVAPGIIQGSCRFRARGSLLSSCTRSSRPTRPTSPTSCFRPPPNSNKSTCMESYGHLYAMANHPGYCTTRRSPSQHRSVQAPGPASGLRQTVLFEIRTKSWAQQKFSIGTIPAPQGLDWATLCSDNGWQRLDLHATYAPFAAGRLSHALGKVRVPERRRCGRTGLDPLPDHVPPRESAAPTIRRSRHAFRWLFCRRRPATFSTLRLPTCRSSSAKRPRPSCSSIRPTPPPRNIGSGDRVRIFNDRGQFYRQGGRQLQRTRPGGCHGRPLDLVAKAGRGWLQCQCGHVPGADRPGQRAPTFYDCLVEVESALVAAGSDTIHRNYKIHEAAVHETAGDETVHENAGDGTTSAGPIDA